MKVLKRLRQLVQVDLEAYLLFRTPVDSGGGEIEKRGTDLSGIRFSVLDRSSHEQSHLEALVDLMQAGSLLPGDSPRAKSTLEKRLQRGDACAVAWDNCSAVGCAWIAGSASHVKDQFAQCGNRFPGAVVLYQAYVDERYRGRRLHILLDRKRKDYVRSCGAAETLTFVGVTNFASIRNSMRTNQKYKLVYHLAVKGPKGIVVNFYPKWSRQSWNCCEQQSMLTRRVEVFK